MDTFFSLVRSFSSPNVFNPWTDTDPLFDLPTEGPLMRYTRLKAFMNTSPSVLMLGEAAGHVGCRRVGMAFCSEKLIMEGAIPRVTSHGKRITSRRLPFSESSATIVWGALHQHCLADRTVLWNAFAWHPHIEGNGSTNRKPTNGELDAGKDVLVELVKYFDGVPIVAIGKTSELLLEKLGIKADGCVRHPANGGATEFRQGIADWAQRAGAAADPAFEFSLSA